MINSYRNCDCFTESVMLVFLLLQLLLFVHGGVGDQVEISLNGDSWSLSDTDGRVKAVKAQVPGVVHLDLMYEKHFVAMMIV